MYINIREILYKRTGKRFPKFLIAPLEKLIHQEELNTLFASCEGATPGEFLTRAFEFLNITYEVEYTTPLPEGGRYIFASNHPFGGLDGMLLVNALLTRWGDAGAVVNDLLMNVKYLVPLWIPINKYGKQNAEKSRIYDEAFASPTKQILTFPAGFCSRFINGEVADTEWKSHFIKDAIKYNREVVPTFVDGTLSKRFYRIYRLRKFLHININLELILLVDEMFKQRGRHIRIIVGEPVDITTIEGSRAEQCAEIRKRVYNLKKR
jgi:putative hemolysin